MGKGYFEAMLFDLADLTRELSEQCLAIRRGFSDTQRTGAIFASHPVALDLDSILWLREYASKEEDQELREQALRTYFACVAEFVKMDLLLREETLSQFYREAAVRIGQKRVSLAEMENWLMTEADFERRQALIVSASPIIKRAASMKGALWEGMEGVLREDFGFKGYLDFCEQKKSYDLIALARDAEELLILTDEPYREKVLKWVSSTIGREPGEVSHLHMLGILSADSFRIPMTEPQILSILRELLEPLGLWGQVGRSIHLDASSRPGKAKTSRCVPLRVPHEIYVMLEPNSGFASLEAALHEMGHALHLANVDPSLPYPYRHLARSHSLSECFAFLFEALTRDPDFLVDLLGLPRAEATSLCLEKALKHLYVVRRYGAKLAFQVRYFQEKEEDRDLSTYSLWMHRATGFLYEPEEALLELEEEIYSADYLRAWAGEVLLRGHLQSLFGKKWYRSPEAGQYLRILWSQGEREELESLLEKLCFPPLGLKPIGEELQATWDLGRVDKSSMIGYEKDGPRR